MWCGVIQQNDFVLHHQLLDLVVKLREQMRWAEFEKTRMKQEVGRVRRKWELDRKKMQEEREYHHKVVTDMEYNVAQLELKAASGNGFKSGNVVAQEEDCFLKLPRNIDPEKLKKLKDDIDLAYERVLRFVKDVRREMVSLIFPHQHRSSHAKSIFLIHDVPHLTLISNTTERNANQSRANAKGIHVSLIHHPD
jgi:hypothetical protein